ncbi:histidinol-phosphate transaminase [Bacillus sp. FJAT-27225]|uniref:histidinol-phosphate transaminase n=1 Tax=Bacillus sp. FJAT-27225 TaxID=1743144 RepID=UPI00080C2EBD|nr:histidinol-phosphate transaminase [Bacillus sp. FJAT-27225]OCA90927.1 histidinol-phosphate transaminase [Bacillus sp. FJAT-27225]
MRWKDQVLSLKPYQPGKSIKSVKEEFGLEKIVKLASNENPLGCSKQVIEAIKTNPIPLEIYPDGYAGELRSSLAEKLGIRETQLIIGNGSDEIIEIISRSLLYPGVNTVMAAPTFSQYSHNAIIEGAEIREVPLVDGNHDLDGMLQCIDNKTTVVWICSPNNPTGTYIPNHDLIHFLEKVPSDVLVVIDEAYFEYVVADDFHDSVSIVNRFSNVIALRTFSKAYGLAGLRIGYGIADEAIIRALDPAREPFNANALGQFAAKIALQDQEFIATCREENRRGLEMFYRFCEKWDLPYYPSQGNFILVNFRQDANQVFQFMLERGFIVRSGAALGFPESVRITVGTKEQIEGIFNVSEAFLEKESQARV